MPIWVCMQVDDCAEEVADGNGLQGVREQIDALRVEGEEVSLNHHAEEPEQEETAAQAPVNLPVSSLDGRGFLMRFSLPCEGGAGGAS